MKVLTDNQYYGQIANVIREQNGTNNTYTPPQMVSALKDLFYEEVEGVPPISFNGIGENLLDYRIDGASGGVGDRTSNLYNSNLETNILINALLAEQSSNDYKLSDYIIIPNDGLNISGFINLQSGDAIRFILYDTNKNIIERLFKVNTVVNINNTQGAYLRINYNINMWDMSNLMVVAGTTTPLIYEPYGYKVPVVVSGKNLLSKLPYSRIDKGIEYTNVNNLYLHIEGTSNAVYSQTTPISLLFKKGKYYINFYCDEQYKSKLFALLRNNNNIDITNVYSSGASFELNNDETIKLIAGVRENNTTINTNMYIQIVSGITSQSTYEPYHEPTTTNIYLDNPIRTVEDEVEYIDYSEQKHHRVRKNLLQNTATTQTINGVTFTVNNDKSITCNGTATGTTAITINTIFSINSTKISGCPMGGSWSSFELDLLNINTNNVDVIDTGNGAVIQNENSYRVRIRIASGYTCNNLTFYPMIRKADIEDDTYEPYIENTEVDVTLPAIPTLDGTNTLSIGTTVQPSNVYVKSRHESSYEAAMRERYEEVQAQLDALESGGE